MLTFMEYITQSFYRSTDWNQENLYENITESVDNLLEFSIPQGAKWVVSSRSTDHSCSSYSIANNGIIAGSLAYLHSTVPLAHYDSSSIELRSVVAGYKQLTPLKKVTDAIYRHVYKGGARIDTPDTLLYGKMYLPGRSLESMFCRRLSPSELILVTCVSDPRLAQKGALTLSYQRDVGRYGTEVLFSTYDGLIGLRGLYNADYDSKVANPPTSTITSRFSWGAEVYYGIQSRAPGLSTGMRFACNSTLTGTPLTLTLLANPLMGHLSATYAVKTSQSSAFASKLDFNFYSYLSDLVLGCELWTKTPKEPELLAVELDSLAPLDEGRKNTQLVDSSVLKAAVSLQSQTLKLLWEGRFKDVLLSGGLSLQGTEAGPVTTGIGLSIQFSG